MSERTCYKCRWWDPFDKGDITELSDGDCRRYPPNVPCVNRVNDLGIAVPETIRGAILMGYPITFAIEWCGEFQPLKRERRGL